MHISNSKLFKACNTLWLLFAYNVRLQYWDSSSQAQKQHRENSLEMSQDVVYRIRQSATSQAGWRPQL